MTELNTEPSDSLWSVLERHRSMLPIVGSLAIVLLVLCAYWSALSGEFIWDDDYYVTNNTNLQSWEGLKNIWVQPAATTQYYPLANTVFWVEHRLFDSNPTGYHAVNALLHACSAILLWVLLRRLNVPAAWMAAAVFALHPVQVESVAWITELKNCLSGVFYFSSMLVYLRYCTLTPAIPLARTTSDESFFKKEWFSLPDDPTRVYALAIFLFACALASKSVTATMPAAVLLLIWWKRGKITLDDLLPLLPFFALGIGMSAFTGWWEVHTIGASGPAWTYGSTPLADFAARCIIAGRAIWFYLAKLLFPFPLIFSYERWNLDASKPWQYLFPVTAAMALVSLWALRRAIGRGPLVAALFFVGTLTPALGFVNVYPMQYSFVADHFQYLACVGIIVLAMAVLARVIRYLVRLEVLNPAAAPAAAAVLLGALAIRTAQHAVVFHDMKSLWEDTIVRTGGAYTKSWFASNNYGLWLLRTQHYDAAEKWFHHALRLKPDHAPALYNLGLIAEHNGDFQAAFDDFSQSQKADGDYDLTNEKLAEIYGRNHQTKQAIALYQKLVDKYPDNEAFRTNLGVQLANAGAFDDAINQFNEALRIDPDSALAHLHLGDVMLYLNHGPEAVREFGEVIRIDPKNAYARVSFGRLMASLGHLKEAVAQFQLAIENDPKLLDAYFNLGRAYVEMQDYNDAIVQFHKLLELSPNYPGAKASLDFALDLAAHPEKRPATTRSTTQSMMQSSTQPASNPSK